MSCNHESMQRGFLEEWTLDCADYSGAELKKILKTLSSTSTRALILTHMNLPQRYFWSPKTISTLQVIDALKQNPFIETLDLSNDFVKSFAKPLSKQALFVDVMQLAGMSSLKHLILDNQAWDEQFSQSLFRFLADKNCQLQSLTLKHPLSNNERQQLANVFKNAPSLQLCQGSDFIWNRRDIEPESALDLRIAAMDL